MKYAHISIQGGRTVKVASFGLRKICVSCHIEKPAEQFGWHYPLPKSNDMPRKFGNRCKTCINAKNKSSRTTEKDTASCHRRYERNPRWFRIVTMIQMARMRSRKHGLPFDITADYLSSIMTTHCPILELEFDFSRNGGATRLTSPSLDRFYPHLGYVMGNVHVISHLANTMKSSGTVDQIIKLAAWIQMMAIHEVSTNQLIHTLRALPT